MSVKEQTAHTGVDFKDHISRTYYVQRKHHIRWIIYSATTPLEVFCTSVVDPITERLKNSL